MPVTRIYLPVSRSDLDRLAQGGVLAQAPVPAFAVTAALGRPGLVLDEEELEHQAWLAAIDAASSGRDAGGEGRRVVASADIDAHQIDADDDPQQPARITVAGDIPKRRVVSFHVDESPGDEGHVDLLWYDVTELADVIALLDS